MTKDPSPSRNPAESWVAALASGNEAIHHDIDGLPPSVQDAARVHGLLGVWVIPVPDPSGAEPALITLWSADESARAIRAADDHAEAQFGDLGYHPLQCTIMIQQGIAAG